MTRAVPELSTPAGLDGNHPVIGVGIDLVDVGRMERILARRPRFAERVFTAAEWDYCRRHAHPAEHAAARFAAKEAVVKVLGTGVFSVRLGEIEVTRGAGGGPSLALTGRAAQLAAELGVQRWLVSLSHTDGVAGAVVVGLAD